MKKEFLMIQLKPKFQKEIFQRLISEYGSSIKASQILGIPAVSIRGYKNLYFNSVPRPLLDKLLELKIIKSNELNKNVLGSFNKDEKINQILSGGRNKRRKEFNKLREALPTLTQIMSPPYLDFAKWLEKYKFLLDMPYRKLQIKNKKNYIILSYTNFAKTGFKNFKVRIPSKFLLEDDFYYFFGLWCGDRAGGKRFGICNKNKNILSFSEDFLKKNLQKTERILYMSKNVHKPKIRYDKKFIIIKETGGWVLSVHSNNCVLASFFYYLQSNLEEFLSKINNPSSFFAGLFDAEGNVSLYNKSFRWACKNQNLIKIYSKFLKQLDLYDKYDGSCLVSYDKKGFFEKIIPYLRNENKINTAIFLYAGMGELPEEYINILRYIKQNQSKTAKEIAKALKKNKVYSELKLLKDFNYILSRGYPYKFKITPKGLRSLGA